MEPLYEGAINRKRLYLPRRLDDVLFALRLEEDCVASFRRYSVPFLALRHPDVFMEECELLKGSDKDDVFGERYLCADTEEVKRKGRHLIFRDRSLEDLSVSGKSLVCLDVIGEELIMVKKEDWPKYVAWRLVNSK